MNSEPFFMFDRKWNAFKAAECDKFSNLIIAECPELSSRKNWDKSLSWRRLPFWPDARLIRVSGFNSSRYYPAYFIYIEPDQGLFYLNGDSFPIHLYNNDYSTDITKENVIQYLMFFCFFVHGGDGPFLVLNSTKHPLISRQADAKAKLAKFLKPIVVERNKHGWLLTGPVLYCNQLSEAMFQVYDTGEVTMVDDSALTVLDSKDYSARKFPPLAFVSDVDDSTVNTLRQKKTTGRRPRLVQPKSATENEKAKRVKKDKELHIPFFSMRELERQKSLTAHDQSRTQVLERYIDQFADKAGYIPLKQFNNALDDIADLKQYYPNFSEVIDRVKDEIFMAINVEEREAAVELPPFILDGPPGIGKTRFLHDLAKVLNVYFEAFDMAAMTAGFELGGSTAVWRSGQPGKVVEAICRGRCANPIILLDELDKLSQQGNSPVESALFSLLEPMTAKNFQDEYLKIKADCSHINWVATCNDFSRLPEPIQSRFDRLIIKAPNREEKELIVQSVYKSLRQEQKLTKAFTDSLTDDIVRYLAGHPGSPREIKQILRRAVTRAVTRVKTKDPNAPIRDIAIELLDLGAEAKGGSVIITSPEPQDYLM